MAPSFMVLVGHDEDGATLYAKYSPGCLRLSEESYMAIKSRGKATPKTGLNVSPTPPGGVKSSFTELKLPNFIGQVLEQYQDLLVPQIEKEVKGKALAAVKEESHLLHYQALERLRSMESEVQQRAQVLLEQARERIFEMIREEMEAIFGDLEASFQGLLEDVDQGSDDRGVSEAPESPVQGPLDKPRKPGGTLEKSPYGDEKTTAKELEQRTRHQEVCLDLPPPLDLKPLMEFYGDLSEMQDVRVLQAFGSVDKGISFYVRPKQLSSLTHLLRSIPSVREVCEGTSGEKVDDVKNENADNSPTLRILLTSTSN